MLSKTSRYGVRAVLYIAAYTHEERLIGVRQLAEKIEISEHMLSKVLQYLTKRDLIKSKKGRKGGFYMTADQKSQNLMHVIRELEQTEFLISACMLGQKHCKTGMFCPYHEQVTSIRTQLKAIYGTDTIEQTAHKVMKSYSTHIKDNER